MSLLRVSLGLAVSHLLLVPLSATTLTQLNVAVTETFDSLASSGTSNTVLPAGWSFSESGSSANTTYAAGTGSSSTGNTYSFGLSGATDRSFGTLRTASLFSAVGTQVRNETGGVINTLAVAFTGEQWRLGTVGRPDRLDFAYSLDATSLASGTWTDFDLLDFVAPVTTGTTGALNGTLAVNQSFVSGSITGLSLGANESIWLRWSDFAASSSNDGLGIDDVMISAARSTVTPPNDPARVPEGMPLGVAALTLAGLVQLGGRFRRRQAHA